MCKTKLILTSTLLSCVLAHAQPFVIMSGNGTSADGLSVSYETRLEPSRFAPRARVFPGQPFRIGGGIIVSDEAFHRFIVNRAEKAYFGYDVTIEPVGGDLLSVDILPLTIGPKQMNLEEPGIWRGLELPQYPPKQVVPVRGTLALDLMVDPQTGQKIVDYLTFGEDPSRELRATGIARDLTLADVELNLQRPRILIKGDAAEAAGGRGITATTEAPTRIPANDQAMEAAAGVGGSVSGRFAWLYLAPHGRFVFSVVPRAELGFRKAGKIRGKTLSFEWRGSSFDVICTDPIIPSSGAYNLYVFHDAIYRPRGADPNAKVQIGATDVFPVGR